MISRLLFRALLGVSLLAAPALAEVAIPRPPVAVAKQRLLPLQGGQNFRDLGGYRTRDGRHVRWGLLYRSGSMHFLTPADYAYLEHLGIRTVCDFRDSRERAAEPALWPAGKMPTMFADDYRMDAGSPAQAAAALITTGEQARAMLAGRYPGILKQFNSQYRRMFGELLAGRVPLAFNCSAGKDRTGVAAALLLTALGVPRETVIQDYLLTNKYLNPDKVTGNPAQAAYWKQMPPDVAKAYLLADRSYIEAAFKVMDSHAGGASGYLHDELGLSRADIVTLRRMYTA